MSETQREGILDNPKSNIERFLNRKDFIVYDSNSIWNEFNKFKNKYPNTSYTKQAYTDLISNNISTLWEWKNKYYIYSSNTPLFIIKFDGERIDKKEIRDFLIEWFDIIKQEYDVTNEAILRNRVYIKSEQKIEFQLTYLIIKNTLEKLKNERLKDQIKDF